MRQCLSLILLFSSSSFCFGQPLRDINYEYLYNPERTLNFDLKAVRSGTSFLILYDLQVRDTVRLTEEYSIAWESRGMLSDREGDPVSLADVVETRNIKGLQGRGSIDVTAAPRYIVAKVIHNTARRAWVFYERLEPDYPVNNFLMKDGSALIEPFVHTTDRVQPGIESGQLYVSYYDDNFPAAAPAFSEAQARVARTMVVDSLFTIPATGEISFSMKGLYLVQKDTNSLEALAFRSEEDYPQYTKLGNLPGPLIYITTRQEYDRLEAVQGNKRAFDRVILSITVDTDRARLLMRNYFRRVELANRFFTSYKEGWKTDRGMVYIVFGKPDEVYRFDDREVWRYDNSRFENITFTFSRSPSLFDPENYVLIREKKYEAIWYEVIDLWRNARF